MAQESSRWGDSAGGETIAEPGSVPVELILGGHLQHAETGYPLEGLRIVAKVRLPDGAPMVVAAAGPTSRLG